MVATPLRQAARLLRRRRHQRPADGRHRRGARHHGWRAQAGGHPARAPGGRGGHAAAAGQAHAGEVRQKPLFAADPSSGLFSAPGGAGWQLGTLWPATKGVAQAVGAGAVVRFLSPLMGSLAEPVYNIGYRLSNITRGIAAGAAALRGLLNVHKNKIMSMTIAEIGNIGAAAAPNGIKHMMLSGFQFFLFVSRAILAALRTQKNNAHAEKVVNNKVSVETIDDLHKYEPEIREPSRRIITLVSDILTDVKGRVNKAGLHSFFGTIIGNITATAAASLRMLKDVAHDIRLIIPSKRMSEKSGEPFIGVPSPVHLLNLAGWFSGLFTLIAGSIGLSKRFGNISEGTTFNRLGRWGVSLASLSAVPGIISNAIDVYNNQQGYPKEFSSMLGKTFNYNPQRAGLLQALGGAVIGMFSFGNLENPLTAAGFDLGNAFYYAGAGEEEVANSQVLALSQSRRGQVVYKQPLHLKLFDFVKQTITGDKKAA